MQANRAKNRRDRLVGAVLTLGLAHRSSLEAPLGLMPLACLSLRYSKVLGLVMSVNQDLGSSGKAVEPRTEGALATGVLSAIPKKRTLKRFLLS